MARTHRAHLSEADHKKRGGKLHDPKDTKRLKSYKQSRVNDRARLKKEQDR